MWDTHNFTFAETCQSFSLHTSQLRKIRRGGEARLAVRKRKFVFHFHCIYEIMGNKKVNFILLTFGRLICGKS